MANAGIDQSNVPADGREIALLLPEDPDASARRLSAALSAASGTGIAVVINDSFGRAWRLGTTGIAIGAAGLPALLDRRGEPDLFGRPLQVTMVGYADEIAAGASLLMGQAGEGARWCWCADWRPPARPARRSTSCGRKRRTCSDERSRGGCWRSPAA